MTHRNQGCNIDCLDCKRPFCKYDMYDGVLNNFDNEFPHRLKLLLRKKKMPQYKFAKEIGISPDIITKYVNGGSYPRADTLIMMCKKLGCSADYLLGLSDKEDEDEIS